MRTIAIVLIVVIATLFTHAWAQNKPKLPEANVALVKDAPKIDGLLDDPAWKDATVITDFKDPEGNPDKAKTRLLLARDDKNFYLAVECFEDADKLKKLVADVKEHNGEGIYNDDSVELFIDPTNHRKSYYHVIINCKNVTWESVHEGDDFSAASNDWAPKYQSATKVGDKSWVVEMAIPFDQFDRTPNAAGDWAFNFLRNRNLADAGMDLVYWSPINGSAHNPSKFGLLKGMLQWTDRKVTKKLAD